MTFSRRHLGLHAALGFGLLAFVSACGDALPPQPLESRLQLSVGQCTRNDTVLDSSEIDPIPCAFDDTCPCGAFCAPDNVCRYECRPLFPGDTGCEDPDEVCNDLGRCVPAAGEPPVPEHAPQLAVSPRILTLSDGAAPRAVALELTLDTGDTASLAAAATATVTVMASDGFSVSCDGASFAASCAHDAWIFSWDGALFHAQQTATVRRDTSDPLATGELTAHLDLGDASLTVPIGVDVELGGRYAGFARSPALNAPVELAAVRRGALLVVRDDARLLSGTGVLVLDVLDDDSATGTVRRTAWISALDGDESEQLAVDYVVTSPLVADDTGAVETSLELRFPGGAAPVLWQLALVRVGDAEPECAVDADCETSWRCPGELGICVPEGALEPATGPLTSELTDPSTDAWWSAIASVIGTGDDAPAPVFATSGPHLIERLLCSTSASAEGNLGAHVIGASIGSRSGDLSCATAGWSPRAYPGAVGLVNYRDRNGSDPSEFVLERCLDELEMTPGPNMWTLNRDCVNPARFYPALRALATGDNDKVPSFSGDLRVRGMFVRLAQQWLQLQGFVASQATSILEYGADAEENPGDAAVELERALDHLDRGFAALLDHRIADGVREARAWTDDYRVAKRPVAYWNFDDGSLTDLIHGRTLTGGGTASGCAHGGSDDALERTWNCPPFQATVPGITTKNMTVSLYGYESTVEFPPYEGSALVMTPTMGLVYQPVEARNIKLGVVHPVAGGGVEWVGFNWTYGLANHSIAVVRDVESKTYTLHVYDPPNYRGAPEGHFTLTQRYYQTVTGSLPNTGAQRVYVGGGRGSGALYRPLALWRSFAGQLDDVAIWNTALSEAEFLRFARARKKSASGRHTWPANSDLADHEAQELGTPLVALAREADAARLGLVASYLDTMQGTADVACFLEDADARAAVARAVERASRAMRQSFALDELLTPNALFLNTETRARLDESQTLARTRRDAVVRGVTRLGRCANPYGFTENEVPLYFSLPDDPGPNQAFFAASDYLRDLATEQIGAASTAFGLWASAWTSARQSRLQEASSGIEKQRRLEEIGQRYGEQLRRLCGIDDMLPEQVLAGFADGTLSANDCFVRPTPTCRDGNFEQPIRDADPACYRGQVGSALLDVSAAQHAFLRAHNLWQAAIADAEGAERLCVLREMDEFGCSALDRHELQGVSCPTGFEGTLELVSEFNAYVADKERSKGFFRNLVNSVAKAAALIGSAVAAPATGGGSFAAFVAFGVANMDFISTELEHSFNQRKRQHEEMLRRRATLDALRTCWAQAEQLERAIASAEEGAKQALAQMQSGGIAMESALGQLQTLALEGPLVLEREQERTELPLAFHYWVSEHFTDYRFAFERAKRYTYLALRAAEYDTQQSFRSPSVTRPSAQAILTSSRPGELAEQLQRLRDHTNTRDAWGRDPSDKHTVIDVGQHILALDPFAIPSNGATPLGDQLIRRSRAVYDRDGSYVGQGIRFTFLPHAEVPTPTFRCAERLWRANVGAAGGVGTVTGPIEVKLYQRNLFASRMCDDTGLQVATLRPEVNLFVATGDAVDYTPAAQSRSAGVGLSRLDSPGTVEAFLNQDAYRDGASPELAGSGLYADYVLLIPKQTLNQGVNLGQISELMIRFDYVSVDNSPIIEFAGGRVHIDAGTGPIVIE